MGEVTGRKEEGHYHREGGAKGEVKKAGEAFEAHIDMLFCGLPCAQVRANEPHGVEYMCYLLLIQIPSVAEVCLYRSDQFHAQDVFGSRVIAEFITERFHCIYFIRYMFKYAYLPIT